IGDLARALLSGGKLVLCPKETLLYAEALHRLMVGEQVDCAEFVPVVLRNLVVAVKGAGASLAAMRVLVAGSDAWYSEQYEQIEALCPPHTRVINSYGL